MSLVVTVEQHREMVRLGIKERADGMFQFKKRCRNKQCYERVVNSCYCAATVEDAIREAESVRSQYHHSTECHYADMGFWRANMDPDMWEGDGTDLDEQVRAVPGVFEWEDPSDHSMGGSYAKGWVTRLADANPTLFRRAQEACNAAWAEDYDGDPDDGECDCELVA